MIIPHLKSAFKIYYEYIVDSKIPYSIFTAYIQGFHGWAAGEIINGEYVEYDGTSGANLVMFVMLDYYLELKPFLKEDDFPKYFSSAQRSFLTSIKASSFRTAAEKAGHIDVMKKFEALAKQLRTFRSAHRKRTRKYLSVERPERVIMTAGSSVMDSSRGKMTVHDLVEEVDAGLAEKMINTD